MAKGGSGSHWDGCEEAHHDCALAKLREAQAVIERLGKERDELVDMLKLAAKNEVCCPSDTFECGEDADKCESCVIEGWRRKVAQRVAETEKPIVVGHAGEEDAIRAIQAALDADPDLLQRPTGFASAPPRQRRGPMASIDAQIDAAVESMKALNEELSAPDGIHHAAYAAQSCNAAEYHLQTKHDAVAARRCIVRAMVRCALALSLLPTETEEES
jgi:hypothetical protein